MPSSIPYVDEVLSVTTGCSGDGCPCAGRSCWAEAMVKRFPKLHQKQGDLAYRWPINVPFSQVVCHPEALDKLAHWRKPRVVLVSALGDLFDKQVPAEFIREVWSWMVSPAQSRHTYLVLTKQPQRMGDFHAVRCVLHGAVPGDNIWLGVSVWDQESADRMIPLLLDTPAAHRWVSYEPALGPVKLTPYIGLRTHQCRCGFHETENELMLLGGDRWFCSDCGEQTTIRGAVNWVVAGCESGRGARPCETSWLLNVAAQCEQAGVPCYLKQLRDATGKLIRREPEAQELPWTLASKRPRNLTSAGAA